MSRKSGNQQKSIGHQARKRFGQNFLQDAQIIERIINSIAPQPGDNLVEIGPGLGAITESLLEATNGQLQVVELDRDLVPILRTKFFNYPDFVIHEGDALKFDFNALASEQRPLRLVGNLPYNISTPLIFHLLEQTTHLKDMHFMLQKEVVDRLAAVPNTSAWGRLAIMTQYYCRVQPLFIVPPTAFRPQPKVQSAIVKLIPHKEKPITISDPDQLSMLVRTAFTQRRKTLRNALSSLLSPDQIEQAGIDPSQRPENLTLANYVSLTKHYLGE
jgi:16S rRNA (adenine1518-N6/adenine1519-N6)-dimethyltransferase